MTRSEAEAAITNLIRTRNLLTLAVDSAETARIDCMATMDFDRQQVDHLRAKDLRELVNRKLLEYKATVYDDAKAKGQI